MLNKVMLWLAKRAIGKHLVGSMAWAHKKADGKRSELLLLLGAVTYGLKAVGVLPPELADNVLALILPILPVTLADKAAKAKGLLDGILPQIKAAEESKPAIPPSA